MSERQSASGNIYDLGYRRYEGVRLGRRHAVVTLYLHSLRAAFGLGRPATAKIVPFGLAILALIPATIQLGIAAVASDVVELYSHSGYYSYVQWIIALFVAAVAPELVGRDQRSRVLTLYFSRSLLRVDYALAKVAALTSALFVLTLLPQLVLFAGRAFAQDSLTGYIRDNWKDLPPILASGLLICLFFGAIALAIASQSKRRAFATGGVLAYFAISFAMAGILLATLDNDLGGWALLLSPFHIAQGFTLWMFNTEPSRSESSSTYDLYRAGIALWVYGAAAGGYLFAALGILYRRYQGIAT